MIAAAVFRLLLCGFPAASKEVPVEIALGSPMETGIRIELLVRSERSSPLWVLSDSAGPGPEGSATLRAPAGRPVLLIVRKRNAPVYRLEGPFEWPRSSGQRPFRGSARRTVSGSGAAAADLDFRFIGAGPVADPLCEVEDGSRWRCLGVPADFAGRIVACAHGEIAGAAEVRPDAADAVSLRRTSLAAAFRVESPDALPLAAVARLLRPVRGDGFLLAPDPSSGAVPLGDGIVWIEASSDAPDRVIELRAPGHATRRLRVGELCSPCAGPDRIELARAIDLRGQVSGPDGEPVVSATVLARSDDPATDPRIAGDATTDGDGAFVFPDLEPRVYRIRVCHAELGCREERASPGETVRIALDRGAAFAGRAVSSAGVPEVDASVRIVPTADAWTASRDRVGKLPLRTQSGRDGRFRIAAPEPGDFLVEVRGATGGVARAAVRRTTLSPAVTDLGDLRLTDPVAFTARVRGCGHGLLTFSGPLGGETSLPDVSRFRLDSGGAAPVTLGEPGAWAAWAACSGENETVSPPVLPDVSVLDGTLVEFERAGALTGPE